MTVLYGRPLAADLSHVHHDTIKPSQMSFQWPMPQSPTIIMVVLSISPPQPSVRHCRHLKILLSADISQVALLPKFVLRRWAALPDMRPQSGLSNVCRGGTADALCYPASRATGRKDRMEGNHEIDEHSKPCRIVAEHSAGHQLVPLAMAAHGGRWGRHRPASSLLL